MKTIFLLLAVVAGMALTQSCEGDQGPKGDPGNALEAAVYEISGVNFVAPSYGIFYTFPQQILASDHLLVYRLSGVENGIDVWQPLPHTYFFSDGTRDFEYGFDFTQNDVNVFLDGNDLESINSQYRSNQVLRFVSVPGYFANKLNTKTYKEVTETLQLTDADFKKTSAKFAN